MSTRSRLKAIRRGRQGRSLIGQDVAPRYASNARESFRQKYPKTFGFILGILMFGAAATLAIELTIWKATH